MREGRLFLYLFPKVPEASPTSNYLKLPNWEKLNFNYLNSILLLELLISFGEMLKLPNQLHHWI